MTVRRTLVRGGGLLLGLLTAVIILLTGMRAKSPRVLGAVRRVNRAVFNPQQMKSAGTEGAYASIIEHRVGSASPPAVWRRPVSAGATGRG